MKRLGDFVCISSGYTYRNSLKYAHKGDIAVMQMADVSENMIAKPQYFARLTLPKISDRYFLRDGDLVMRSRGRNKSAFLIVNPPEKMICIAPLFFLRIFPEKELLPKYLHWYLNLQKVQDFLQDQALVDASGLHYVRAIDLANLRIPIPTMQRQEDVIGFYTLEKAAFIELEEICKARLLRLEDWLLCELDAVPKV